MIDLARLRATAEGARVDQEGSSWARHIAFRYPGDATKALLALCDPATLLALVEAVECAMECEDQIPNPPYQRWEINLIEALKPFHPPKILERAGPAQTGPNALGEAVALADDEACAAPRVLPP